MLSKLKPPLPHEHGSWVMLIVPLVLGLAVAPLWRWRSLELIGAALGLFLLRYPLATIVKTRQRPGVDNSALWRWSSVYAGLAAICGGTLIFFEQLGWLALFGLLGGSIVLLHLGLVARRQEMSALGELLGIFGLALGAPMAYYTNTGQLDDKAAALWIINALYFGGTTFYIKLKVRQQPRVPAPDRISDRLVAAKACLTYQGVVLTFIIATAALNRLPLLMLLAFAPMTIKVLRGASRWQDKKSLNLPRLGVIEVVHSVLFAALVIMAF
jgi:hypothetical protein